MLTDAEMEQHFPYPGGKALAQAGIRHLGEEAFRTGILPIYRAICRIHAEEFGQEPSIGYLAEALQYRDRANLENLATYGLPLDKMHLLEYGRGCHAAAVRAEAVRRVLDGQEPGYRSLVALHDVSSGGEAFMPHDKDIMDLVARRKGRAG
ncbi:MAG TPA: hypothetical protein VKU00_01665 [Chthonomonadaceae bacterium]|nr:hypothetical protein [Chthonomonadaceae bacterium]